MHADGWGEYIVNCKSFCDVPKRKILIDGQKKLTDMYKTIKSVIELRWHV